VKKLDWMNGQTIGIILFFIGLYGLMTKRSIVKTIAAMDIMESGVFLFWIAINFTEGSVPPIGEQGAEVFADPVPSALMITSIVIGMGATAIALTMFMHYKQKHGITHWSRNRDQGGK